MSDWNKLNKITIHLCKSLDIFASEVKQIIIIVTKSMGN